MTKKNYETFAAIIADAMGLATSDEKGLLRSVAYDMAEVFESDNPRFDRERFLKAAGVK